MIHYLVALSTLAQETGIKLSKLQEYTKLIEVLIWPLTVVTVLLIFRKKINKIRIKSLNIDKTGKVEVNMFDNQLKKAEEDNFSSNSPKILAKSGGNKIIPGVATSHAQSVRQGLLELDSKMNQRLMTIAKTNGITLNGTTNFSLVTQLSESNSIDQKTANQLKSVIELIRIGISVPNLTQEQVDKTKELYNRIKL